CNAVYSPIIAFQLLILTFCRQFIVGNFNLHYAIIGYHSKETLGKEGMVSLS
ncbi:MAG: hypothetical protein H6Q65_1004, partial [Firmicutes bacterium]|nr:hypothetical protein [Bacillota bacterium]